jgi:hypothetical protein
MLFIKKSFSSEIDVEFSVQSLKMNAAINIYIINHYKVYLVTHLHQRLEPERGNTGARVVFCKCVQCGIDIRNFNYILGTFKREFILPGNGDGQCFHCISLLEMRTTVLLTKF